MLSGRRSYFRTSEAPEAQPIPEVIPPPPFFHEVSAAAPAEQLPHVWPFAGAHKEVEGELSVVRQRR